MHKGTIAQHPQQHLTLHMFARQVFTVQQVVLLQLKLFVQLVINAQQVVHHQPHVQLQTNIRMKLVLQFVRIVLLVTTAPKLQQLNANLKMKVQATIVLVA